MSRKRFVDKQAISELITLLDSSASDTFNKVELVQIEANLHNDMARYPWLNQLITCTANSCLVIPKEKIAELIELENAFENENHDGGLEEEVKNEKLNISMLNNHLDLLENGLDITHATEEEALSMQKEIHTLLDPLCEQLLNLRFFLGESQGNEQILRIGEEIIHLLSKLNEQMPDVDTLLQELVTRFNQESDAKLIQMAKSSYAKKLNDIYNQLKNILEPCEKLNDFLKTKIYGGILLRRAMLELQQSLEQVDHNGKNTKRHAITSKEEELLIKEMLQFDFTDKLTQLQQTLTEQLKRF